jgi:transposase-like protein
MVYPGMEDYPRDLVEFEERFSTEEACTDYLRALRWGAGFHCPGCGGTRSWRIGMRLEECVSCGHQTSLIAGTIFENTKKPLSLWFRAMWQLTSQKYGANALGMQRVLGFGNYRTAWAWLHKLRRAMIRPGRDRIDGIIQVDETFVGGAKPGKRGRGAAGKTLVLIAAQKEERRIGRIRLRCISDASAESLEAALQDMVSPGAIIQTDGWKGYNRLAARGYRHEIIRRDASVGEDLLPKCHRVAGLLKTWLAGTLHGAAKPRYLDYYLDEYTFRFNRRTSKHRGKLFYRLVQQAVAIDHMPIPRMIQEARNSPFAKKSP